MSVYEIPSSRVDVVLEARALFGEGPLWDFCQNVLRWVDLWGNVLHTYDPSDGRDTSVNVGQPIGAVALCNRGGLILALRGGFWLMDEAFSRLELIANVCEDVPRLGLNDGRCDSS